MGLNIYVYIPGDGGLPRSLAPSLSVNLVITMFFRRSRTFYRIKQMSITLSSLWSTISLPSGVPSRMHGGVWKL